jgi:hypothetical protein
VTDGVTVESLPASLQHKTRVAMDCGGQIALNWKLSHKLRRWCKFSSHVKMKSRKKKLHKMRPASIYLNKAENFFLLNTEILPSNCTQLNMFCVGLFLKTENCEVAILCVYAGKHCTSHWHIPLLLLIVINFPTTLTLLKRWTCNKVSCHSNCSNSEFYFKNITSPTVQLHSQQVFRSCSSSLVIIFLRKIALTPVVPHFITLVTKKKPA